MTEAEERARERIERNRSRRQEQLRRNVLICAGCVAVVLLAAAALVLALRRGEKRETAANPAEGERYIAARPEIDVELLPVNDYSRPGTALAEVTGIVIHYTANPGTTAMQNRDYFAGLAETHTTSASSHFIIGLEGEIVQCIPCDEIAYATKERNVDTISIECCIEDESGRFNAKTYASLVELVTWLMGRYDLDVDAVLRHYDVTGKNCPKYYVENESSWRLFKSDLTDYIEEHGVAGEAAGTTEG